MIKDRKIRLLSVVLLLMVIVLTITSFTDVRGECSENDSACEIADINKNNFNSDEIVKTKLSEMSDENFVDIVTLQGLNKITAKISEFDVKVGETAEFGRLEIKVHKCWKAPPEERPENKVLLEISEYLLSNRKEKERIFYGWMFSSSPGLSALEHPMYDITVIDCKKSY